MADHTATSKLFWTTLFEQEKLASQMHSISTNEEGVSFTNVGQFGNVHIKCRPASALGDNFMSDTFIVSATVQDGTSFRGFIKVLPSNTLMQSMALVAKVYDREIEMYRIMFDQLRQLRQEADLNEDELPIDVPTVYYVNLEEKKKDVSDGLNTCVLLEDLKAAGFEMADKYQGCDDAHVRVALRSLANYHALGIAAIKKWKGQDGELNLPPDVSFMLQKSVAETVSKDDTVLWLGGVVDMFKEEDREDLSDWIKDLLDHFEDVWYTDNVDSSGPLATVLHGDFWCNNMLFKYEEGVPTQLKMVDFQIARFAHPLNDILYFLYTSTVAEVRRPLMNSWLSFYFTTLTTALEKLNAQVPDYTFENFMLDMKKRCRFQMLNGFGVLKMILDKGVVSDLEEHHENAKDQTPPEIEEPKPTETNKEVDGIPEELMEAFLTIGKKAHDPRVVQRVTALAEEVKAFYEEH